MAQPSSQVSQSSSPARSQASAQNRVRNNRLQSLGNLTEWRAEPQGQQQGLSLKTDNGSLRVVVYSPSIIRVRVAKEGQFDDHSYAVITEPQQSVKFATVESSDAITLTTDALKMVIHKNPVRVQFMTLSDRLLNEDEPAFGTAWQGTEVTTYKRLLPDERFIGLGEKTGGLNRRGTAYTNWNTDAFGYGGGSDPIYGSHPFYMGLHSGSLVYGIFFDNCYKSYFNFGASNDRFSSFGAEDGEMNYYFISRGEKTRVADVIEDYTHLTGRTELPPMWSLGYHQCRYSYFPDSEVLSLARTIREKKIPADVLWFDIHYMDAYKVFTWHPTRFPNPKKMLSELESMGFKTVVITDPGIKVEAGYAAFDDGLKQNIFLKYPDGVPYKGEVWPGWCHFPDFTSPKGRAWWGDKLKGLISDGIDGFWTDMNEPATWGQAFPNMVEFDFEGNTATHKKGRNVFGLQMARATYEGSKKLLNGKRPFNLTRASYSGVQRYGAVWTGDNTASDEHLMLGARLVSSMGLAGIPFAGVDVGGFNGNGSRELFARWLTLGAFTPFFRVHAAIYTKEQDPWSFGEDVEEISKNYIELRYRLLPYLYSAFYEASKTGIPVARSLAVNYPFDAAIYERVFDSQYLFGASILVAPVDSRQHFAKVYLPEGDWYNAHTDERTSGNRDILVEAPLERLPLFIKDGAIIPMQSVVQSTAQKPDGTLYLHVYNDPRGGTSSFTLYEDDGETYKYQQKDFAKREILFESSRKKITFVPAEGSLLSKFNTVKLFLHGFDSLPAEVRVAGKKTGVQTEAASFIQPLSGHDPLGAQGKSSQQAQVKTFFFKISPDTIAIEW